MVSHIVYFHPYLGKIPILTNIFQMGWNHQPEKLRKISYMSYPWKYGKKNLKPRTWCQVNGYIKLYHILPDFPYAPIGRSRTQPHMPTQKNVLISNCGHSLDKRSTTDEERPRVLFLNFRWYKRHPKFFGIRIPSNQNTKRPSHTRLSNILFFFRKSMIKGSLDEKLPSYELLKMLKIQ